MNIDYIAIISALGLGSVLTKIVDYWISKNKARDQNEKAFTRAFNAYKAVFRTVRILLRDSGAQRVILLKSTNGGGRPSLGGRLYSTIMLEDHKAGLVGLLDQWQNQALDAPYIEILVHLSGNKNVILRTCELAPGMLKDMYLKHKIEGSYVFEIAERETEYIYLSVVFDKLPEATPYIKDLFRSNVSRLAYLYSKNNKI